MSIRSSFQGGCDLRLRPARPVPQRALQLWQAYVLAPWTRDGRVSAQVIRIAPEVSGSVEAVFVADNQRVARGDPLYRIDPRSYRLAVRQREGGAGAGAGNPAPT